MQSKDMRISAAQIRVICKSHHKKEAMETFALGLPPLKGAQSSKQKNNNPLIFFINAKIFLGSFANSSYIDVVLKIY